MVGARIGIEIGLARIHHNFTQQARRAEMIQGVVNGRQRYLQAQTQPFWEALCELTGLAHLARDQRFADMRLRKANEAELVPQLRAALMRHGAREWEAIFGTRVPCTVVRGIEEVFDDDQVAHQGLLETHAHPTLGSYRAVVEPIRFNGERGVKREARAPMLGEHTEQVVGGGG